ncbi:Cytochrome c oxidase subunit [Melia azedarach]|uniref:Cytochrome c oxidase subunit n=1 Tax=Melia azedarach TaxID=155640 RepID=A0ACC1YZX9_MELAZ|nr:Cytochrome c oxidase subunit [Melia azedarach]
MSASQLDPHDKMRARDVNKVTRGEQAPRPAHESGTVSQAPVTKSKSQTEDENDNRNKDNKDPVESSETAPAESHFPTMNQTRRCYARYVQYLKCIQEKGKTAPECEKFAEYYRFVCPNEWIEDWNKERASAI